MIRVNQPQSETQTQAQEISELIGLSNQGCLFIYLGDYRQALGVFSNALRRYKKIVDQDTGLAPARWSGNGHENVRQDRSWVTDFMDIDALITRHCCHNGNASERSGEDGISPMVTSYPYQQQRNNNDMGIHSSYVANHHLGTKQGHCSSSHVLHSPNATAQMYNVYSTPIQLPPSPTTGTIDAQDLNNSIPTVIMFNLALTYHLMALSSTDGLAHHSQSQSPLPKTPSCDTHIVRDPNSREGRLSHMERAIRLYDLTYELVESDRTEEEYAQSCHNRQNVLDETAMDDGTPARCLLFTMVLMNNLGLAHKSLRNESASRNLLDQLVAMLMVVLDDIRRNGRSQILRASSPIRGSSDAMRTPRSGGSESAPTAMDLEHPSSVGAHAHQSNATSLGTDIADAGQEEGCISAILSLFMETAFPTMGLRRQSAPAA